MNTNHKVTSVPALINNKDVYNQTKGIVTSSGKPSNPESLLFAEWNRSNKGGSIDLEIVHHPDIDKLFDTLADWNNYLENHVPYFQEPK